MNAFAVGDIVKMKADNSITWDENGDVLNGGVRFAIAEISEDELRKIFMARLVWVDKNGAVQVAVISTDVLVKA